MTPAVVSGMVTLLPRHYVLTVVCCLASSVASAQPADAPLTERIFRYPGGADIATVSPTTGHPELVIPVLNLRGQGGASFQHSFRYSQARRLESNQQDSVGSGLHADSHWELLQTSGSHGDVHPITAFSPRPWRTMPFYRLRAMTQSFIENTPQRNSVYLVRYLLSAPSGQQVEFREFVPGSRERYRCNQDLNAAAQNNRWRAIDGSGMELDHSNPQEVIIRMTDGTRLSFPWPAGITESNSCVATGPAVTGLRARLHEALATKLVDANGNWVTFADAFDTNAGTGTVRVTTSVGAYADFEYRRIGGSALAPNGDPSYERLVEAITFPGVGGERLRHRFIWSARSFSESRFVTPIIPGANGRSMDERTPRLVDLNTGFMVLDRIELADGSSFDFRWHDTTDDGASSAERTSTGHLFSDGRLMSVRFPAGGRTTFEYAADPCSDPARQGTISFNHYCRGTPAYVEGLRQYDFPAGCEQNPASTGNGRCIDPRAGMIAYRTMLEQRLDWRRVARTLTYDGLSSSPVSTTSYSAEVEFHGQDCRYGEERMCGLLLATEQTGTYKKVSKFFLRGSKKFGQLGEVIEYDADRELRRTTHGFLLGSDAWAAESMTDGVYAELVNMRSLRTVVREGAMEVDTRVTYDRSAGRSCVGNGSLTAAPCFDHTRMLVTEKTVSQNGALLTRESFTYETRPEYVAALRYGLLTERTLANGAGVIAQKTSYEHDTTPLEGHNGARVEAVSWPRGNVTLTRTWLDAGRSTAVASTYFANGEVASVRDPRGATARFTRNAAPCEGVNQRRTMVSSNDLGQSSSAELDCHTGVTLKEVDENGGAVEHSFDVHGRLLATWVAGDSQAAPTTWLEYFPFWVTGNVAGQRSVEHTRDGTASGIVTKKFFDGLGRIVQTRSELDPANTVGGYAESVSSLQYDERARVTKVWETCGDAASDVRTGPCTTNFATTSFDALGRTVLLDPPGPSQTRTSYQGTAEGLLATAEDAEGGRTKTVADALGRAVRVETYWNSPDASSQGCAGGFCPSVSSFDAAGRLLSVRDVRGNVLRSEFDWAGNETFRSDPDVGTTRFAYNGFGELESQSHEGFVTRFERDVLGRVVVEDRPPAGPGTEDVKTYYDGNHATDCYSCDDHDSSTIDRCNPQTLLCEHVVGGEDLFSDFVELAAEAGDGAGSGETPGGSSTPDAGMMSTPDGGMMSTPDTSVSVPNTPTRCLAAGNLVISCISTCGCDRCEDAIGRPAPCPVACRAACPDPNAAIACRATGAAGISFEVPCSTGCGCTLCHNAYGAPIQCPSSCSNACTAVQCTNAAALPVDCRTGCGCTGCTGSDGRSTTCPTTCSAACPAANTCGFQPVGTSPVGGMVTRFVHRPSGSTTMSTAPSVPGYEVEQSLFYLSPTRRMGEHKDLVPLYSCAGVVFDKVCTACDASIPYAGVLGFMSAVEIPGVTLPLHHLRSSSNAHRYEAGAGPFNWPWTDLGVVGHVFRQPVGLSSTTRRFTSAGGAGSVRAETQGWWQAQSSQDWIEVPFANHLNTDNASFSVAPNPGGRTRLGFIGVNNASLSVLQSGTVGSFNDVTSAHLFYDWINLIGDSQIMRGCGSSNFCSEQLVKRDEMAEYIIRAMFGESFTWNAAPYFTDVPSTHPRFKYVQKMRELGITSGCTTTTYCPTDNVLRGQMAVFVTRALFGNDFVAPAITPFDDVPPTHLFFKWVQKFRELGITSGCTATSYCVDDNVTNGQMAVFLSRAFLRAP